MDSEGKLGSLVVVMCNGGEMVIAKKIYERDPKMNSFETVYHSDLI